MNDMDGRRVVMHPAWQAAHELLNDGETWWQTMNLGARGYTTAQIVTAMRCMGYGPDVTEIAWRGALAVDWTLPDVWIPVELNNSLDVFPRLMAILDMPTLADVFRAPEEFVAGFVLVDEGVHALPADVLAVLNGVGD